MLQYREAKTVPREVLSPKFALVIRSCNYHIRALRHIRPLLTLDVANTIGHSIVASRLDYANALLHGTSAGNLDRLQVTQNSLARTVLQGYPPTTPRVHEAPGPLGPGSKTIL